LSFAKRGWQYAVDVIDGKIIACAYVQQACQRQIDDLETPPAGYHFDAERAERICKFAGLMKHIKGKWAGKQIELEAWQIFILTTVFGWVDDEGNRRYKTAYIEVPRKNAKSTLSSVVALYCLSADGEAGAEVYSAATTRDQARIVWNDAKQMAVKSPGLRKKFGVDTSAHSVHVVSTASHFKALSRDQGGNLDGLNTHCAVIDELHAHKTRDVFDVMETSTSAREQSLLWLISTAGFNRAGICYEQRAYVLKILSGIKDESYFGIVYTLDDGDDWQDPTIWAKANPNWGVSVKTDDIERKARKAMQMSAATNNFLTKHLNVWVNADTAWMDMRAWERCADLTLDVRDFEGEHCYGGLDLATKFDVASRVKLFEREGVLYCFETHYLPEDTVEQSSNSQYQGWEIDGYLTTTPGNVTDFDVIEDDIKADSELYVFDEHGFDPYQATQLSSHLLDHGLPMVQVGQTVKNLSEPMKELEALVASGRFKHNGNPVLEWMVSNVVAHVDAKDNIYPRKEFPENKIDGVVAILIAINRWLANDDSGHAYADRGFTVL
jgi:phage terminase large subunit-like protein